MIPIRTATVINPTEREVRSLLFAPYAYTWLFQGAIPLWTAQIGIKANVTNDPEKKLIMLNPTRKVANKVCWYAIPKVFAFSGNAPNWAKQIRNGEPPLWAMTMKSDQIVPANIRISMTTELAPNIMAHLK
jgi:hypothetical protein